MYKAKKSFKFAIILERLPKIHDTKWIEFRKEKKTHSPPTLFFFFFNVIGLSIVDQYRTRFNSILSAGRLNIFTL